MKQPHFLIALLIGMMALCWGVASCDNGCEQKRENFLHTSFVSSSGRTLRNMEIRLASTPDDPTPDDGYILTKITKFEDVELDLNPNDSVTYFIVSSTYTDFGDSFQLLDTVRIEYSTQSYFLDMNCGCTINYELLSVETTHNLFSEVEVLDPIVLTDTEMNLLFKY